MTKSASNLIARLKPVATFVERLLLATVIFGFWFLYVYNSGAVSPELVTLVLLVDLVYILNTPFHSFILSSKFQRSRLYTFVLLVATSTSWFWFFNEAFGKPSVFQSIGQAVTTAAIVVIVNWLIKKICNWHVISENRDAADCFVESYGMTTDQYDRTEQISQVVHQIKESFDSRYVKPLAIISDTHGQGKSFFLSEVVKEILKDNKEYRVVVEEPAFYNGDYQKWAADLLYKLDELERGRFLHDMPNVPQISGQKSGCQVSLLSIITDAFEDNVDWDEFVSMLSKRKFALSSKTIVIIDDLDIDRLIGREKDQFRLMVFIEKYLSRIHNLSFVYGVTSPRSTLSSYNFDDIIARTAKPVVLRGMSDEQKQRHFIDVVKGFSTEDDVKKLEALFKIRKKKWNGFAAYLEGSQERRLSQSLPNTVRGIENIAFRFVETIQYAKKIGFYDNWCRNLESIKEEIVSVALEDKVANKDGGEEFRGDRSKEISIEEFIVFGSLLSTAARDILFRIGSKDRLKEIITNYIGPNSPWLYVVDEPEQTQKISGVMSSALDYQFKDTDGSFSPDFQDPYSTTDGKIVLDRHIEILRMLPYMLHGPLSLLRQLNPDNYVDGVSNGVPGEASGIFERLADLLAEVVFVTAKK